MAKKRRAKGVSRHWAAAGAAAALLGLSLIVTWAGGKAVPVGRMGGQIVTIEHREMLTLHFTITADHHPGLVDVWRDGGGSASLSVPETWIVRDVRGALLGDLATGSSQNGYRTHALPAGAHLSFLLPLQQDIVVFNGSRAALLVKWKMIDLETGTVKEGSVLTKDKPVVLR